MLLYHLRGGRGCQNPSNDICDSPGLASHPGLTVTALLRSTVNRGGKNGQPVLQCNSLLSCNPTLQSTVNRRKKIDNLYCNVIPCHPASQRCNPLSTEVKKIGSLYCNAIPCHPAPQPMTCGLILQAASVKFSVACFHIPYLQKENMYMQGVGGRRADRTGGGGGGGGG